jgi:Abnormal spindle-like microcephaly-assoc'd, ASPM-SPD-2-Hydin
MDLNSRWDRGAVLLLLIAVGAMVGCQGLAGSSNSATQNGRLVASNSSLDFGTVVVGSSKTLTDTITNASAANVTISSSAASHADFRITSPAFPLVLAAGQSASLTVAFTPHAAGQPSGKVAVMSDASNSSEIDLMVGGKAVASGKLATSPATVSFGQVRVGQSQAQTATLTNLGGTSVTVSQASASNAAFTLSGLTLPATLAAGQSTAFTVTFAPKSAGTVSGSISVQGAASLTTDDVKGSNAAESTPTSAVLALSGTATTSTTPGQISAAPASLSFGNVTVGTSQNQTATVTNSGGSSVTISQATATGGGFSVNGLNLPLTLSAGQSAAVTVTFAPQASGNASGNVALASSIGALTIPLAGSGLAASSLGASPASISFGNVQVGTNQGKTITLTNGSSSSVTVSQATAAGTGFSLTGIGLPLTLAAGQSTTFSATFAPTASGSASGSIAITSTASNPSLSIVLSGTGVTAGSLAANPTSINFGSVQVGVPQSRSETLTNTGGSVLNLSQASLTGAGFSVNGLNVPTTLNAGQSLTFNVVFTPTTSGSASGSLALTADGAVPSLSLSFSGTGTSPGQLAVAPGTFTFGDVTVGASQNKTGTLTASGASVTVSSAVSNSPEFTVSGLSLPATIAAGQSATFTVSFTPQASGVSSASISFASNATNGPWAASLTGNGTPAPQHSVSLSWNASASTVAGYNVYRGSQTGGPYVAVNSAPEAGTSYVDDAVTAGQTYYYVVTAVDSGGTESVYSNQVQAVIPSP